MTRKGILVVGSANMDMVVMTKRFPRPGETVFGGQFGMFPGGKGANQAVCSARLGAEVYFVGKMGRDVFQERLASGMKRDGIRLRGLSLDATAPTGIALITVDTGGQNEIVVVSGSNMRLRPADIEGKRSIFSKVRVLLSQLEIPVKTVSRSVEIAKSLGVTVILNPAPARKLPRSLLRMIDCLTPNETEIQTLTGMPVNDVETAEKAAKRLLNDGVGHVIVTMGAKGSLLVNEDSTQLFRAHRVKVVDTTAAGDAFNGALAVSLASGKSLSKAIPFANSVAAYSVTRVGAQSSMPTMNELRDFLD